MKGITTAVEIVLALLTDSPDLIRPEIQVTRDFRGHAVGTCFTLKVHRSGMVNVALGRELHIV